MLTIETKVVAIALVCSICFMGYALTSSMALDTPDYDLTIDDMPVSLGDETLRIDTQTNDRAFIIHSDYIQIRSQYLTFYDLNISDGHADTNIVSGNYCYATIASINATLVNVREVNNIGLSTDSGSVTVSVLKNTNTLIKLRVNSSNDAELNLFFYNLIPFEKYKLSVDGERIDMKKATGTGGIAFEYDGTWSSHTLTLSYEGFIYWNDFAVLLLKLGFVLGIGAIAATILLSRRRGSGRG